jgi:hypothetical protein
MCSDTAAVGAGGGTRAVASAGNFSPPASVVLSNPVVGVCRCSCGSYERRLFI